jgi:hypothetical protein
MPIVTDGLIGYWHYQQGVSGSTWENIAPSTQGQHNGQINGAVLQSDGMYFDGVDDGVSISDVPDNTVFTLDLIFKSNAHVASIMSHYISSSNRSHLQLLFDGTGVRWSNNRGTWVPSSSGYQNVLRSNVIEVLTIRKTSSNLDFFVNGQMIGTAGSQSTQRFGGDIYLGARFYAGSYYDRFPGIITAFRLYSESLSDEEITQNYTVGTAIGLDDEPPPQEPPKPTVINISRNTLSDEPNMDRATVTFTFDQDVTEWKVNVLGSSHDTGTLADSGGAVTQGTEITAEIDWTELYQEGQNRINIYGKNGEWTPYG